MMMTQPIVHCTQLWMGIFYPSLTLGHVIVSQVVQYQTDARQTPINTFLVNQNDLYSVTHKLPQAHNKLNSIRLMTQYTLSLQILLFYWVGLTFVEMAFYIQQRTTYQFHKTSRALFHSKKLEAYLFLTRMKPLNLCQNLM